MLRPRNMRYNNRRSRVQASHILLLSRHLPRQLAFLMFIAMQAALQPSRSAITPTQPTMMMIEPCKLLRPAHMTGPTSSTPTHEAAGIPASYPSHQVSQQPFLAQRSALAPRRCRLRMIKFPSQRFSTVEDRRWSTLCPNQIKMLPRPSWPSLLRSSRTAFHSVRAVALTPTQRRVRLSQLLPCRLRWTAPRPLSEASMTKTGIARIRSSMCRLPRRMHWNYPTMPKLRARLLRPPVATRLVWKRARPPTTSMPTFLVTSGFLRRACLLYRGSTDQVLRAMVMPPPDRFSAVRRRQAAKTRQRATLPACQNSARRASISRNTR